MPAMALQQFDCRVRQGISERGLQTRSEGAKTLKVTTRSEHTVAAAAAPREGRISTRNALKTTLHLLLQTAATRRGEFV
jgi:hypothetical protein